MFRLFIIIRLTPDGQYLVTQNHITHRNAFQHSTVYLSASLQGLSFTGTLFLWNTWVWRDIR